MVIKTTLLYAHRLNLNFGSLALNDVLNTTGEFKFGGMVRYCHMLKKIWLPSFKIASWLKGIYTAKLCPPNFPAIQ